jgi:hypothetical protein
MVVSGYLQMLDCSARLSLRASEYGERRRGAALQRLLC